MFTDCNCLLFILKSMQDHTMDKLCNCLISEERISKEKYSPLDGQPEDSAKTNCTKS